MVSVKTSYGISSNIVVVIVSFAWIPGVELMFTELSFTQ